VLPFKAPFSQVQACLRASESRTGCASTTQTLTACGRRGRRCLVELEQTSQMVYSKGRIHYP
jgi:hypothetical protein